MPISGTSAAARITPVPKPPTPLMTAATAAIAATTASVGASSSKLGLGQLPGAAGDVDGDIGERRLGDLHHFQVGGPALGVNLDADRHRGVPDAHQVDVEGEEI